MNIKSILVICPGWVGDLVMATPAFEAIRLGYPEARITYLVKPSIAKVIEDGPWYDEIIYWDKKRLVRTAFSLFQKRFDLAVIFPNSFRSALTAFLARIRHRVGYSRGFRGWLLTDRMKPPMKGSKHLPVPMVQYYIEIPRHLGLKIHSASLKLYFRDELKIKAEDYIRRYGARPSDTLIGINPGASFGSAKCWGEEKFAELIRLLAQNPENRLIVLCSPSEADMAHRISALAGSESVIDSSSEVIPLDLLKAIIARCRLLITNDTGPRHYAAALDVPVITMIGSTDLEWGETCYDKAVTLIGKAPCAPCMLRECPKSHECMESIRPEAVAAEAKRLLKSFSSKIEYPTP